jgi:hypothetical protein
MAAKKKTSKSTPTVSSSSKSEMRKWEIESALSTLKRAEEIRKDSKMMNDVKKMAQEQIKMLGGMVKGK